MKLFKKLFCRHKNSEVVSWWYWTPSPNGNEIQFLKIQKRCSDCGECFFTYIKNWDERQKFIEKYPDKYKPFF